MSSSSGRKLQLLQDLVLVAAAQVTTYYLFRYVMSRLDPEKREKEEAREKSAALLRRLDEKGFLDRRGGQEDWDGDEDDADEASEERRPRRPRKEELQLNQYEQAIALGLVAPEDIPVSFSDIGGLDDIVEELKESVIYPLMMPQLYAQTSSLLSAPSGVLLYGPPGCGKSMLAKAVAHEAGACFINLNISTLTEKWYGDSNKLVHAVFSLARKLQPSIVFIDEIDALLGVRKSTEHEASTLVKAEFMTHWDGLTSSKKSGQPERIVILGATNRMHDIDPAILRRMPKKFAVPLPTASQRRRILDLILKQIKLDAPPPPLPAGDGDGAANNGSPSPDYYPHRDSEGENVGAGDAAGSAGGGVDRDFLVRITAGMSGSEIKEMCRAAAMVPVREFLRERRSLHQRVSGADVKRLVRGVRTADFVAALQASAAAAAPASASASVPRTHDNVYHDGYPTHQHNHHQQQPRRNNAYPYPRHHPDEVESVDGEGADESEENGQDSYEDGSDTGTDTDRRRRPQGQQQYPRRRRRKGNGGGRQIGGSGGGSVAASTTTTGTTSTTTTATITGGRPGQGLTAADVSHHHHQNNNDVTTDDDDIESSAFQESYESPS